MFLWDARQQLRPTATLGVRVPFGGVTAPLAPQPDGSLLSVATKSGEVWSPVNQQLLRREAGNRHTTNTAPQHPEALAISRANAATL